MTPEQADLLAEAQRSLAAARLLESNGYGGFAASRAYYAMFYCAEALLLGKGLAFSKHSAVHGAFGQHFAKTGLVPAELHRDLIRGAEVREAADYGKGQRITPQECEVQVANAERFIAVAQRLLGPLPAEEADA